MDSTSSSARPLVTWIHGGPHGSYQTGFYPAILALALQGCKSISTFLYVLFVLTILP